MAAYAGRALGVDISGPMLDLARRLADEQGVTNIDFQRTDAQVHPFDPGSVDLVISRTGAMFFGRPVAAFTNLRRALTAAGRLVLLTWQPPDRQEWFTAFRQAALGYVPPPPPPDAPGPFSLSDPDRVRAVLEAARFVDVDLSPLSEATVYGRTVEEAYDFVLGLIGWMMAGQDEQRRAESMAALRDSLAAHLTADGVWYGSAAWLITARRG